MKDTNVIRTNKLMNDLTSIVRNHFKQIIENEKSLKNDDYFAAAIADTTLAVAGLVYNICKNVTDNDKSMKAMTEVFIEAINEVSKGELCNSPTCTHSNDSETLH